MRRHGGSHDQPQRQKHQCSDERDVATRDGDHVVRPGRLQPLLDVIGESGAIADENRRGYRGGWCAIRCDVRFGAVTHRASQRRCGFVPPDAWLDVHERGALDRAGKRVGPPQHLPSDAAPAGIAPERRAAQEHRRFEWFVRQPTAPARVRRPTRPTHRPERGRQPHASRVRRAHACTSTITRTPVLDAGRVGGEHAPDEDRLAQPVLVASVGIEPSPESGGRAPDRARQRRARSPTRAPRSARAPAGRHDNPSARAATARPGRRQARRLSETTTAGPRRHPQRPTPPRQGRSTQGAPLQEPCTCGQRRNRASRAAR